MKRITKTNLKIETASVFKTDADVDFSNVIRMRIALQGMYHLRLLPF